MSTLILILTAVAFLALAAWTTHDHFATKSRAPWFN